jgi:hypothetical protein
MRFISGVDLGQRQDYSAMVTMQRRELVQDKDALPGTDRYEREPLAEQSAYDAVRFGGRDRGARVTQPLFENGVVWKGDGHGQFDSSERRPPCYHPTSIC